MSTQAPAPAVLGVAGAGTMGAGIAGLAARSGFDVVLFDPDGAALRRAHDRIAGELARDADRERWSAAEARAATARLRTASGPDGLSGCELVIEAAPESLELKRELFERLERACGPEAILATNTSSLLVGEIAAQAAEPQRICGMHFFNPPAKMRLVEVVAASGSAERALELAGRAAERMGRTPVRCADSPGFIVNRCNRPFVLEALQMLGEGMADAASIDAVVRERGGFPMGPFELVDLIGVDVNLEVARSFHRRRPLARWRPHPLQERLVAAGRLGRKTGAGFHTYDADGIRREEALPPSLPAAGILERLLAALVNEACFAAGEGLASPPDIDRAMRLGLNHPRGPFEWGELAGPAALLKTLKRLAERDPERYEPAPALRRWARGEPPG